MNRKARVPRPCEVDPDFWFPEGKGGHTVLHQLEAAAAICNSSCPVRQRCLEVAMVAEGAAEKGYRFGVFGGLTPAERANLARVRRRAVQRAAEHAAGQELAA
ncbi:WhiB family transcriptional regulator [Kitasatospora phosalacinea]|uniref:WhiB family transcriptional regulator n=1 Tax=Kitasatospora phosalacinea TaxID=2065 RepID=A0ABW6GRA4_9ACTN